MEANRFRNVLQETAETAPVGRERIAVPWHLAGVAKCSADGASLWYCESRNPRGLLCHGQAAWGSAMPLVMPKYRPSS
jgi:hypothetical protein